jgi:thiamine-phosphate diphosphorylase
MHFITSYVDGHVDNLLQVVEEVARAGADVIQFSYPLGFDGHILDTALRVKEITSKYGNKLCINNRMDIANAVEADYLHIGQLDLPIDVARRYLSPCIKIGLTITKPDQMNDLADYYGVGPIFSTTTKTVANRPIGVESLKRITAATDKPVVAIGGITSDNYINMLMFGCEDAAIIGDVYRSGDIYRKVRGFQETKTTKR